MSAVYARWKSEVKVLASQVTELDKLRDQINATCSNLENLQSEVVDSEDHDVPEDVAEGIVNQIFDIFTFDEAVDELASLSQEIQNL